MIPRTAKVLKRGQTHFPGARNPLIDMVTDPN